MNNPIKSVVEHGTKVVAASFHKLVNAGGNLFSQDDRTIQGARGEKADSQRMAAMQNRKNTAFEKSKGY